MSSWDDFLKAVLAGIESSGLAAAKSFLAQAKADALAFANQEKADLQLWAGQLARKEITADDLKFNVQGDADLAEMAALTEAGIGAADLQRFRDSLVDTVVGAAAKFLIP
jgi:hypothetical protein